MKRAIMIVAVLIMVMASLVVCVSAEPMLSLGNETAAAEHPYAQVIRDTMTYHHQVYEDGQGSGVLYDLDGNGVKELILVHFAVIDRWIPASVYSVYTMDGGEAMALFFQEPVYVHAGGPDGYVQIVEKNGKNYIAVNSENSEPGDTTVDFLGTWTLYAVDGTKMYVDTEVEYCRQYNISNSSINTAGSYMKINGAKYSYSMLQTWLDSMDVLSSINAGCFDPDSDVNAYQFDALLKIAKDLPLVNYNGLTIVDGVWGYYKDGVLQADYTGLVPYGNNLFYVENGILGFNYTGLVWYQDAWRYVANSQLTAGYTGLVYFNDNWFYVQDSVIDWSYTGLVPYNGYYFYVQNNLLDWSYTGLGYHDGGWYFIQNALVQRDFVGLVYFNETWFYVEDGHLTWDYTGMVEYEGNWFYVQNNVLDWAYTGLGYHDGGWFFIQNALMQKDYYGLVEFNGVWFYIEAGELDWTVSGLREHQGNLYYIRNGEVDWSFNGQAEYGGKTYIVVNGVVC